MSNVKNCNPGKITMDLPRANYIYELPLLSFADMNGNFNLSLIFNRQMKDSGEDPFFIQAGYKLNIQKRIIFEDEIPKFLQEENGKCVSLYGPDGWPYAFDDNSQRVLRMTTSTDADGPYVIENADYSQEYYDANGMIVSVYDKYNTKKLSYEYSPSTGRLANVKYNDEKSIVFGYNRNKVCSINYVGSGCITNLSYNGDVVTVEHYSGETYTLTYSASDSQEFTAVASSASCSTKLERGSNEMVISESIGDNAVNTVTYTFPDTISDSESNFSQVEITNNDGLKTRIQYKDGEMMYAYEVTGDDVTFSTITPKKFYGSVQIYKTIDDMGADDFGESDAEIAAESAYSAKHVREYGPLGMNDGIPMQLDDASMQRWYYDARVYSDKTGYKGYHLLTGWAKKKVMEDVEHYSADVCISNGLQETLIDFKINFILDDQWQFFAYKFQMPANYIYVRPEDSAQVELKDLRLTFEPTTTESSGHITHVGVSEYVLICQGNVCAPICNAQFDYGNVDISSYGQVYFEDLLKYKINKVKGVNANEVYCNKCKEVIAVSSSGSYTVTYNGESYDLDDCKLAILQYTINKTVITRLQDDSTARTLTYETFVKNDNNAEVTLSTRVLNSYLDVVSETVDGITTNYARNSKGQLTDENVVNLYTTNITYDTQNHKITKTVEIGSTSTQETTYVLDPVWGGVRSVTLPDGTVVTDEYDDDMCALTKRIFGNTSGRSNSFTYSNGNLSGLETGSLGYDFTYSNGKLSAVSKNDTNVEEHVYEGNTKSESYYPAKTGALHSTKAEFDMYGKLLSIDGVLENAYTIFPAFNSAGVMTTNINNASSILGMTTDKTRGEVSRFSYDTKGRLLTKTVTSETDFSDKISEENFVYDDASRLTKDTCVYDVDTNRRVTSEISYATEDDSPMADNRVEAYSYAINDSHIVSTQNFFDDLKRVETKAYYMGGQTFTKEMSYDHSRITSVRDTVANTTETNYYYYDECNRIIQTNMGGVTTAYHYDAYGQLVREDNQGLDATMIYEYNDIGNLISIKKYAYTGALYTPSGTPVATSFGYTVDQLTTFGGATIAYNSMGCPTTYEGKNLTWSNGKLSRMFSGTLATGTNTHAFVYNAYGQRIGKTYSYLAGTNTAVQIGQLTGCNKTYYYDHAGRLISETVSKAYHGADGASESIVFLYDESGIIGMARTVGSTSNTYYFQRNLLGDVVAIYDTSGNMVAKYLYDAWGNCTISSETTNTVVANANPIRYRGYYYDDDTGLYYCNARYYSPKWRRFISPDDTAYLDPETVNGLNLYCYCNNDPVNYVDPSGSSAIVIGLIIGAIVGASIGFGTAAYMDYRDDGQIFNGSIAWYDYLGATLTGAVVGAAIGAGIGYCLPAISSFAGSSFSFGGRVAMLLDGTAVAIPGITVTGAQILITVGTAMTLSTLIMFTKGSGPRLGHNQHEDQMWREVMRRQKITDKDLMRRIHDKLKKYPYQDTVDGLEEIVKEILRSLKR